jgi:hypothetical protein
MLPTEYDIRKEISYVLQKIHGECLRYFTAIIQNVTATALIKIEQAQRQMARHIRAVNF